MDEEHHFYVVLNTREGKKPKGVLERMRSIAYLFNPIGSVNYQHEQHSLESHSTYHTSPKSLKGKEFQNH